MAKFAFAFFAARALIADASAFLSQSNVEQLKVSKIEVESALMAELRSPEKAAHLEEIERELAPMYSSLPKDTNGNLEAATVRYALHRYFVRKHSWVIKGLDTPAAVATFNQTNMHKAAVISHIQALLGNRDIGLHELAVFAATISDVVQNEAIGSLSDIFTRLGLPLSGPVTLEGVEFAIKAYMVFHLTMGNVTATTKKEFQAVERDLRVVYPAWVETVDFASDLRHSEERLQVARRNPFTERIASFEEASSFVQQFGRSFGGFQNNECRHIKNKLLALESAGTGRVKLTKFYEDYTEGRDFKFMENVQYLRELGALDETNPRQPSVVIPNYVTAASNCLTTVSFYAVCCANECDTLMGHLEREIAAESSEPSRVAQLVSSLPSDTVDAPRNISASLMSRLHEISAYHDGVVPLHGRLFAQWMHHVYPRECPFPHAAGSKNPMTPEEYAAHKQEGYLVTYHDAKSYSSQNWGDDTAALPWTTLEERVVGQVQHASSRSWARFVMALAALVSLALAMLGTTKTTIATAGSKEAHAEKCFV